jgi:hypothetical protein
MKPRTALKSIALISLVLSWLTASMAPGLLVHFSVGSRMLVSAARTPGQISAVTLAMIRGELCGFATEVNEAEEKNPEDLPLESADTVKIVLSLVDRDSLEIVRPGPEHPHFRIQQAGSLLKQTPPGPPPKLS